MQFVTPKWKHRDFFAEINAMVPEWVPTEATGGGKTGGGVAMYDAGEPPDRLFRSTYYATIDEPERNVKAGDPCAGEFSMPFQEYVRAMDPAGNVVPLIIKGSRIPSDDNTGYGAQIVAKKRLMGWLICERVDDARKHDIVFDTNGKDEADYGEYLREEFIKRRKHRMAHDTRKQAELRTDAERHQIEMMEKQNAALEKHVSMSRDMVAETVAALVPAITQAVVAAMAANQQGKGK